MSTIPDPFEASPPTFTPNAYPKPLRSLAILAVVIFLAEMVSMTFLHYLEIQNSTIEAMLDGLIMVVLILPGLYFLQLKPMINQMESRDQAESALRASESLFRKVLEFLPVGVWITDPRGKIIHGNPASQQIWAGSRYVGVEEYGEYKGWWADTGERVEPNQWAAVRAISQGESILNEEIEIETFDGNRKFILNSAVPILDEQGISHGAIIVNQDITQRRRAQREMIRTNELLERFFFSISTAMAYMDREFNFIRVNETYARSAGHTPEFFVGKNHFELYPHEENQAIFQRVVETGEPYEVLEKAFEYAEYPDRGVTYWDWSLQPAKGPDGSVQGVVLSLVEVTQRKQAEIQLERQNQELRVLSEAESRQRELAEGLVQATIAVNSSLELDQVLCSILEQIRRAIPFQGADIVLVQGNSLHVASFLGFESFPRAMPLVGDIEPLESKPLCKQVCQTQKPVVLDSVAGNRDWQPRPGMEWVRCFVAVPLLRAGSVIGIINLYSQAEMVFDHEAVEQLIAFAGPAATALNNAQLYQAETSARQIAEALSTAAQELTRTLDLEHVFNTLLDHIRWVVPSDTAGVTLLADENRLAVRALRGYGSWADREEIPTFPTTGMTDSLIQRLKTNRKSLTIPNVLDFTSGEGQPDNDSIRAWLVVPIVASEKVIGLVEFGRVGQEPFPPEQIQLAEAMVAQAAVAIQNAWLFEHVRYNSERLQTLARKLVEIQENERYTIARELHDEAGQALSSMKLNIRQLEQDPDCSPHIRQRLQELKDVADNVLEELHRLAMDLRPVALDRLGLVSALEQLAHNMNTDWLSIRFKAIGFTGERLPKDIETAIYRIVQEALTNVVHHAHASTVGILIEKRDEQAKVFIEDDGIGFDSELLKDQDRLGLVGMNERAEMLGGTLTIESSSGKGTSIIVEVPVGHSDPDSG